MVLYQQKQARMKPYVMREIGNSDTSAVKSVEAFWKFKAPMVDVSRSIEIHYFLPVIE